MSGGGPAETLVKALPTLPVDVRNRLNRLKLLRAINDEILLCSQVKLC